MLAEQADEILLGPRATLGPPWAKDHRMALAATILAGEDGTARVEPWRAPDRADRRLR